MALRESFEIAGRSIKAGTRATVDIPVADLFTHTAMSMPVHVIHGRRAGPRMFVCAAIHGDEINGVEIIRRLLRQKRLRNLKGTLIAVPVVNVYGFVNNIRYLPDRRDLNRFFPGTTRGSLTSRLAHTFMEEILARCTHGIDLHTGSNHRQNLPQIRAKLADEETRLLAQAFGAPVILDTNLKDGSLRNAAAERGIRMLLYEAGEALRFNEMGIRGGLRGILSVMAVTGMIPSGPARSTSVEPVIARSSSWVRTPSSGIIRSTVRLGDRVKSGQVLGEIADPFGAAGETIECPFSGIVVGRLNLPLVHEGDAVFHIARFEDAPAAESVVEAFHQEFEPNG